MSTSKQRRPIGVFDSGIGGLTVLKELARLMPQEDLIYFGDTAHVPYGTKSRQTVARYSLEIGHFLVARGVKMIVVACNTSSALALEDLRKSVNIPVLGVIEPGARAALGATRSGRIGVIATEATIGSGAYPRILRQMRPNTRIFPQACPLFVPLVEVGWWRKPVTEAIAREYARALIKQNIDTLILGCTHYPLLKPVLSRVFGAGVKLVDSALQTALSTQKQLCELNIRRDSGRGRQIFYASDDPQRFLKLAQRFGVCADTVKLYRFE